MRRENIDIRELTAIIDRLGAEGGGTVEITGTRRGVPRTIVAQQTEWHDSPVCLVGGYGHEVSSIRPSDVSGVLHCVIGNYLDVESFSVKPL